jgi:hypothetical protein
MGKSKRGGSAAPFAFWGKLSRATYQAVRSLNFRGRAAPVARPRTNSHRCSLQSATSDGRPYLWINKMPDSARGDSTRNVTYVSGRSRGGNNNQEKCSETGGVHK